MMMIAKTSIYVPNSSLLLSYFIHDDDGHLCFCDIVLGCVLGMLGGCVLMLGRSYFTVINAVNASKQR